MRAFGKKSVLFLLFVIGLQSQATDQFAAGSYSLGLSGTGRAGLSSPEAAFLNPALVGLLESSGQVTYMDGAPAESAHRTIIGASLVDAEPNNMSNGVISYRKIRRTGEGLDHAADGELWHGALGKILSPHFVFFP